MFEKRGLSNDTCVYRFIETDVNVNEFLYH